MLEADHKVVDVAHQPGLALQPALDHALEPEVEHIMQVQVAQQHADRPALWGPFFARMDRALLHDARFQPAPDQADQAWVPDSMFNKPEQPLVREAAERGRRLMPLSRTQRPGM